MWQARKYAKIYVAPITVYLVLEMILLKAVEHQIANKKDQYLVKKKTKETIIPNVVCKSTSQSEYMLFQGSCEGMRGLAAS